MRIRPRESYSHPGPLGPALDLDRVTGWDIHHTATSTTESPYEIAETTRRRFGRSSYNFVSERSAPDDIWEMQGLHVGAHNDGENSTRLGLVFIGYHHAPRNHAVLDRQVAAAAQLMAHAHEEWGIPLHAKGHRETDPTACPGDLLDARINDIVTRAKEITEMAQKIPQPSWLDDDIITDLLNAGVLTERPEEETLEIWRTFVFLHRTLDAASGSGVHNHDGRYVKAVREIK